MARTREQRRKAQPEGTPEPGYFVVGSHATVYRATKLVLRVEQELQREAT